MPNKLREVLEEEGAPQEEGVMDEVTNNVSAPRWRRMWGVRNLAIVGFLVVVAGVGAWTYFGGSSDGLLGSAGTYQAVFLDNNQVYFGKLSSERSQYPVLRDIYYLQANRDGSTPVSVDDVNLVKLGGELHGPVDEMRINRDQILLIEDLKNDSQVVDAINRYKASQQGSK